MIIITSHTSGESFERKTYRDGKTSERTQYSPLSVGFTKPDKPVINSLVNGYRRPSSYSCPAVNWNGPYVETSVFHSGPTQEPAVPHLHITERKHATVRNFAREMPAAPDINNLRTKILNNIRDEVFDAAMVIAEMQSTVDTVTSGLGKIGRSLEQIRRRRPDSFSYLATGRLRDNRRPTDAFLRDTASTFLEWKYGMMPVAADIQGACKALDINENGGLFDNPPLLVSRAVDKIEGSKGVEIDVNSMLGRVVQPGVLQYYIERKARCDFRVTAEGLRGLNRYGLGIGTIPTLLFERTPFSFVLNMAFPLGDLIKAWTALSGCQVVGYSETTYRKASVRGNPFVRMYLRTPITTTFGASAPWVSWERTGSTSVPMPLPFVRNPIKTGNLATTLALFTQLRRPWVGDIKG